MSKREKSLDEAIYQLTNDSLDPNRPFDGQPHTDQGERGKTLVAGLRFRDVADCFVKGWLDASSRSGLAESGDASYNDVYEGEDVDPLAVMKNMLCRMERMMGVYPNVPKPHVLEVPEDE